MGFTAFGPLTEGQLLSIGGWVKYRKFGFNVIFY